MTGENGTPGLRPRRLVEEPAAGAGPARGVRVRRRALTALSAVWTAVRPTRSRGTGYVALGAVGALIGTSVAVGVGTSGSVPELADVGAWLSSSQKGSAAHANGLTGEVDGKVDLPTGKNPVSVSQDGKTVLVLDKKTGKVVRIDPAQLTAEQSTDYSSSDLQLVAGGSFAYVVNPVKGTVQRIDPVRTSPIGAPVDLGAKPLGRAVVDPRGTLWVPEPTEGKVVPFPGGRRGTPLTVAEPGANLELTLANGQPVVTDTSAARMTVLATHGPGLRVNLPSFVDDASPETVLVPHTTDGAVVPVLASRSGQMALIDVTGGQPRTAVLGRAERGYGAPQVLGTKVYVPDENGTLKVYDTADSALEQPIEVTGEPGELELFVRNGLLWVNDQDNSAAAVIKPSGDVNRIGKYKDDVPSAKKPEKDTPPAQDNTPNDPVPETPRTPVVPDVPQTPEQPEEPEKGPEKKPERPKEPEKKPEKPKDPEPSTPAAPKPQPSPPGTPQAQAGNGSVTISFSPSSGTLRPTGYRLNGSPAGARVAPARVAADGPFQFQVSGLSCGSEYSFTVIAEFEGGETRESGASAPVMPCTAPSAPQGLNIVIPQGGKAADVAWQPPANASGTLTYTVTWPGGSRQTSETGLRITGLSNGRQYTITVASNNEAGGGASVSGTADTTPPTRTMNIAHNDNDAEVLAIRNQPSTQAGGRAGTIPGNSSPPVTVYCKTTGTTETHEYSGVSSNVWARITYNGTTGYVADIYLDSRTNPDVWECE
jgi:hypothetical protein